MHTQAYDHVNVGVKKSFILSGGKISAQCPIVLVNNSKVAILFDPNKCLTHFPFNVETLIQTINNQVS